MNILVLSDSHGCHSAVDRLMATADQYDAIFYLGDGLGDIVDYTYCLPHLYPVRGNCDYDYPDYPDEITVRLGGVTILATHGHRYNVKYGLQSLNARAMQLGADLVLYGHTHQQYQGYGYGNIMLLNPGHIGGSALSAGYCKIEVKGTNIFPIFEKLTTI